MVAGSRIKYRIGSDIAAIVHAKFGVVYKIKANHYARLVKPIIIYKN